MYYDIIDDIINIFFTLYKIWLIEEKCKDFRIFIYDKFHAIS